MAVGNVGGGAEVPALRVKIVKLSDNMNGFAVLPRRWALERAFSWLGRNRRLAKDLKTSPKLPD